MKTGGPGQPQGKAGHPRTLAAAYDIEEWYEAWRESQNWELKQNDVMNCRAGWPPLSPYVFRLLQGFPGDLARSSGEDATLGNVLWMLDEHYGVMMTFNTLSKEFYSLKQGLGENVAKFRVCLSQQVQILQTEYPSRIQQEHVEEGEAGSFLQGPQPQVLANVGSQGQWWKPCHLFWIVPCCPETGQMGGSQRPPAPENHYCQEFKCNSLSLTGKIYFHPGSWRVATPSQPNLQW